MTHALKSVQLTSIKAGPQDGLAEGQFTAYASVFGNIDSYGDVVVKGAFAETIVEWAESGNTIPLLFGHNMSDPDYNVGSVLKAVEDDHGLLVTGEFDMESPKGPQVYRLVKGRRLSQLSFAYDVIEAANGSVDGKDALLLTKLKLYEVSLVSMPANSRAKVTVVKSKSERPTDVRGLEARLRDTLGFSSREARRMAGPAWRALEHREDDEPAEAQHVVALLTSAARSFSK